MEGILPRPKPVGSACVYCGRPGAPTEALAICRVGWEFGHSFARGPTNVGRNSDACRGPLRSRQRPLRCRRSTLDRRTSALKTQGGVTARELAVTCPGLRCLTPTAYDRGMVYGDGMRGDRRQRCGRNSRINLLANRTPKNKRIAPARRSLRRFARRLIPAR